MNILIVTSSAQGEKSVSSRLAAGFAEQARAADPASRIVVRDVGRNLIPHLTEANVAGIRGEAGTDEERAAALLSDELIDELLSANVVVIASPMYNFGISSTLKTWFDYLLRPRIAFRYSDKGPEGLLGGRKVIVIESRAGVYSEGPMTSADSQEPHLRTLLGFAGLTDVTFVRAEGMAFGEEAAAKAISAATDQLAGLAREELALAA